ncbi:MAG TPA: STAS domain-containing protein [Anaeromyxobacteraceae bacterium]
MVRTDQGAGHFVVLSLEGTFDAAEAWRVHDMLAQLAPGTRVSLDFREVRAFHDFAIALLAQDILARHGRVEANGLCQHQRRILKYFGVDEAGVGEPDAPEARVRGASRRHGRPPGSPRS